MKRSFGHRSVLVQATAVLAAVLLAGCSGASTGGEPVASAPGTSVASPSAALDTAVTAGVDPEVAALLMLTPAEQEAQLADLSATLERDLWTQTGLESELGGPADADVVFTAFSAAMVEQARELSADPSFGRFGGGVRAADDMSLGALMFGGWLVAGIGAEGIVKSTNDAKAGAKRETDHRADSTSTMDLAGSVNEASLDTTIEKTVDGVTGKLHVKVQIAPCPDANGEFTSKIQIEASATTAGGRTGANMNQEVDVTGRVGDDAELSGYDTTTRSQAADFANSKGSYVDVTSSTTWTGGKVTAATRTVNRSSGSATERMAMEWANSGTLTEALVNKYALEAAEKAWKSGRCVDLQASTSPGKRTGLKPSATVSVVAAPKSKVDGSAAGGTVTAQLNGGASVDPAGTAVPADATFAYVAPGEKDQTATVALEARSKRGIGKAEVTFDTKAGTGYFIGPVTGGTHTITGLGIASADDGSTMGTAVPADVCDITKPFTLTAPDTGGRQTFTPTSPTGGTTTYQLTNPLMGFTEKGKGTYTLSLDGENGRIVTKVRGRVTIPGSGQSWKSTATQFFDLEPATSCS